MSDGAQWVPTHRVPDGGTAAWTVPDPAVAPTKRLGAGAAVHLVEEQNGWGRVMLVGGRTWWVDARALEPVTFSEQKSNSFLDLIARPGQEVLAFAAVIVVTVLTSLLLAPILAIPGNLLKDLIEPGNCSSLQAGTGEMYRCSVKVGFLTALGPLLVLVVGIFVRRPIMEQVRKLTAKLPRNSSTIVMPLISTAVFSMVYASIHSDTMDGNGLVPNRLFPALLGVLTFLAGRLQTKLAARFQGPIIIRDKVPALLRVVIALALPMVISYFVTKQDRVTQVSTKEQFIALLTVFTSYAAFLPRDGDFFGAAQRLLMSRGFAFFRKKVPGPVGAVAQQTIPRP